MRGLHLGASFTWHLGRKVAQQKHNAATTTNTNTFNTTTNKTATATTTSSASALRRQVQLGVIKLAAINNN
jgi:hypothetical protein